MTAADEAVRALWNALAVEKRPASIDTVARAARRAWDRARSAHPTLKVSATDFMGYLHARLLCTQPLDELGRRHIEDMYLACGCAKGEPTALKKLEETVLPAVLRHLKRIERDEDSRREVLQKVREQMLVESNGVAGIAVY